MADHACRVPHAFRLAVDASDGPLRGVVGGRGRVAGDACARCPGVGGGRWTAGCGRPLGSGRVGLDRVAVARHRPPRHDARWRVVGGVGAAGAVHAPHRHPAGAAQCPPVGVDGTVWWGRAGSGGGGGGHVGAGAGPGGSGVAAGGAGPAGGGHLDGTHRPAAVAVAGPGGAGGRLGVVGVGGGRGGAGWVGCGGGGAQRGRPVCGGTRCGRAGAGGSRHAGPRGWLGCAGGRRAAPGGGACRAAGLGFGSGAPRNEGRWNRGRDGGPSRTPAEERGGARRLGGRPGGSTRCPAGRPRGTRGWAAGQAPRWVRGG